MMGVLDVDLQGKRGDFLIDARFQAGAGITALSGPSGSGKTSILRGIAGLWAPDAGHVRVAGSVLFDAGKISLPVHQRRVGCVFQTPVLFPHMSVSDNLEYGVRNGPMTYEAVLELLDIASLQNRMPKHLSGGEAQRVALGRALLTQPKLLLLDEPLTGLDRRLREAIFPYLEKLPDITDAPILYVTHNESEIKRLATRVLIVNNGSVVNDVPVNAFSQVEL